MQNSTPTTRTSTLHQRQKTRGSRPIVAPGSGLGAETASKSPDAATRTTATMATRMSRAPARQPAPARIAAPTATGASTPAAAAPTFASASVAARAAGRRASTTSGTTTRIAVPATPRTKVATTIAARGPAAASMIVPAARPISPPRRMVP